MQDAFVPPVAALILTAGVFADVHGRKKTCQVALALCAAGASARWIAGRRTVTVTTGR
ncbi:hypothetical protein AB0K67_25995 [Nonomuraea sp. NPDC052634]|uniref:hypothetical protein n=1 Tax=Nonomuraea sp. NPDC052634 TaxID=3155813 RepID=UPI00344A3ACC